MKEYPWTQADQTPELDFLANEAGIAQAETQLISDWWALSPESLAELRNTCTHTSLNIYSDGGYFMNMGEVDDDIHDEADCLICGMHFDPYPPKKDNGDEIPF
jgi:hypothetical protein